MEPNSYIVTVQLPLELSEEEKLQLEDRREAIKQLANAAINISRLGKPLIEEMVLSRAAESMAKDIFRPQSIG